MVICNKSFKNISIRLFIDISNIRDYTVICKNHFKTSDFINYKNKIGLTKEAVPFKLVTATFLF
jgi:hypothetical protein